MDVFKHLTMEQCNSTYQLFKFLKRLRIIGSITAHTVETMPEVDIMGNYDLIDMTSAGYSIIKDGYTSERTIDVEEELEKIFGRLAAPHKRTY